MIISRTGYRISFLGGGSDHQGWIDLHGGCVLSTTIDKYCYLMVKKITNFFGFNYKIVYRKIENVNTIDEIEHTTAKACLQYSGIKIPLELHHSGISRRGLGWHLLPPMQ